MSWEQADLLVRFPQAVLQSYSCPITTWCQEGSRGSLPPSGQDTCCASRRGACELSFQPCRSQPHSGSGARRDQGFARRVFAASLRGKRSSAGGGKKRRAASLIAVSQVTCERGGDRPSCVGRRRKPSPSLENAMLGTARWKESSVP